MTPVFIPWSNERVFERGRKGIVQYQVYEWIWENFGRTYFSLSPDGLLERSSFTFLRNHQALQFKLVWGGR